MVKFILVVITIVFVGLAYYVNIAKDDSSVKTVVKKEESTPSVEEPLREAKKDVSNSKDASIEKEKVKVPKDSVRVSKANEMNILERDDNSRINEESIQIFEEKVAQEFSEKSQYTGKIYGRDDFLGNEVSSDDSTNQNDEENEYTEEWQQREIDTPPDER